MISTTNSVSSDLSATILRRVEQAQALIVESGWSGLIVLDSSDVRWLTGLRSSNAAVVVTPNDLTVATDFRYVSEVTDLGLSVAKIEQSMWSDLGKVVGDLVKSGSVAYPPSSLSHNAFLKFTDALPDGISLRAADGALAALRVVKDQDELLCIRRAADLLEGAYEMVTTIGLAGRSEAEVAWMIERNLREAGASALSFDSIVAGGANGARPHHTPGADLIPNNTLVTVDIGCVVDGYCSDCTRTFAVGNPDAVLLEAYNLTLRAQEEALAAVSAGKRGRDIDAIARDMITEGGHGEHFGHGLGHGVGVDVHEAPRLSKVSEDTLQAGMVVTVEPGIYLPGVGGVRIEDLAIVTEQGSEVLTRFTKELTNA